MGKRSVPIVLLCMMLATAVVYWPGLDGPFILDDGHNLEPLDKLSEDGVDLASVITTNTSGVLGRPVSMYSFALSYYRGGLDAGIFKQDNLVLHLLCGLLVFLICKSLAKINKCKFPDELALAVAAIWLLSPIFVSTVLYAVQRMAQLSALFDLMGIYVYVRLRKRMINHADISPLVYIGYLLAFVIFLIFAAFSKENGAVLPLLVFLLEAFFIGGFRSIIQNRVLLAFFTIFLIVPAVLLCIAFVTKPSLLNYDSRSFTLFERVLTESRVLWLYVRQILLPNTTAMGVFHDDIVVSRSLFSPLSTLWSCLAWLTLAASAWFIKRDHWLWPLVGGSAFYIAAHLIESSIFPLEIYFEHRNYLPAVGLIFGVILSLYRLFMQFDLRLSILRGLIIGFCVLLAAATWQRSESWSDWSTMVFTGLKNKPNSFRLHSSAANILAETGDLQNAERLLQRMTQIRPESTTGGYLQLVYGYCVQGEALPQYLNDGFEPALSLVDQIYTSNSLKHLNRRWKEAGCGNLDYDGLMQRYGRWLTQRGSEKDVAISHSHQAIYYVSEGLLLSGHPSQAWELIIKLETSARGLSTIMTLLKFVVAMELNLDTEAATVARALEVDARPEARFYKTDISRLLAFYQGEYLDRD